MWSGHSYIILFFVEEKQYQGWNTIYDMNRPCSFTFQRIKSERAPLLSSPRQRLPKLFLHSLKKEISTRSNNKFLSRCFTSWTGKWWLLPNVDRSNNGKKRKKKKNGGGEELKDISMKEAFHVSNFQIRHGGSGRRGQTGFFRFDSTRIRENMKTSLADYLIIQGANFHSEDLSDKKFRYSITDITIS